MYSFLLRRLSTMILTGFTLSFIVFFMTNLPPNLEKLAKSEASARMTDEQVALWLENNGFGRPLLLRYGEWLGIVPGWSEVDSNGRVRGRCIQLIEERRGVEELPRSNVSFCGVLQGYWGWSSVFKKGVDSVISRSLSATGILMMWVMLVMVPVALVIGVLSGMSEGSKTDRTLSTFSIASTATPEYVSGVIFIALFASATTGLSPFLVEWGWISRRTLFFGTATSAMDGVTFWNFALPVTTVALYGTGYIARMARASMAEVMTQQYIRTARLKSLPFLTVVLRHALRNALIAPFTVIMLQFPWLLNGVVIVETLFNYKGFGWTLVQAAGNNDIQLLLACSLVAVSVVLITQIISDIGYALLNPRIRLS